MKKIKIITIVGARPQFVKAAALSPCFAEYELVEEVLVHTGQHFDENMSDVFFSEMSIPRPRYNLGIGGGSHGQNTGRMIEAIESVLQVERPDAVLVFGDTDSTLAAAIATSKMLIPLAHVEAGLRSYRRDMPEEVNRVVVDHLADFLYTPSTSAVENLGREGISRNKIFAVGDVMYDVVKKFTKLAEATSGILNKLSLNKQDYFLMTLHRKENTDSKEKLMKIFEGISSSPIQIIFPIHPRTIKRISEFDLKIPECVRVVEPLGYLDTLCLESSSKSILTDSGGVQKEAYFHGVPCITLRDETEWTELVDIGANVLVGADVHRIRDEINRDSLRIFPPDVYGDGTAAEKISLHLIAKLSR